MNKNQPNIEELGENLLEQFQKSTLKYDNKVDNSLYVHSSQLAELLSSFHLSFGDKDKLKTNDIQSLKLVIKDIINDLKEINQLPQSELGPGPLILETYKLLTFAFSIMCDDNKSLNNQLDEIQKKYDELLENSSFYSQKQLEKNDYIQLEMENKKLNAQIKILKKNDDKQLLEFLIKKFNLSYDTNRSDIIEKLDEINLDEIINNDKIKVAKLNEEIQSQAMEIEQLKQKIDLLKYEKQENSKTMNEMNERFSDIQSSMYSFDDISDSASSRAFILENDVKALNEKCNDLESDCKDKKRKIKELKKKISEQGIKEKEKSQEFDELKVKYENLLVEKEDINSKIEQMTILNQNSKQGEIKDTQIKNLETSLIKLQKEIENMNNDLITESEIKNKLFVVVQKQNKIIYEYEQNTKNIKHELEEAKEQLAISEKSKCDHQEIINDILSSCSKENNEIVPILKDTSMNVSQRIIEAIKKSGNKESNEILNVNDCSEMNQYKEENQRLINYISNLLDFMEQISNSGDLQQLLIDNTNANSDLRTHLISQCQKVESFIKENGLNRDNEKIDFFDLSNYASKIASQIENPSVNELISLLQQSSYCNDVLRKFSEELKLQTQHLLSEMKSMKYELEEANNTLDDKVEEKTSSLIQELEEQKESNKVLFQVKNLLRESENSSDNSLILKCINLINSSFGEESINEEADEEEKGISNETYVQQLEHKLSKAYDAINGYKNYIKETENQIKLQKKKLVQQKEQYDNEISKYQETQNKCENELKYFEETITNVQNLYEKVQKENDVIKKLLDEQNKQIQSYQELRQEELNKLQNEFDKKQAELEKQNDDKMLELKKEKEENEIKLKEEQKNIKHEMKAEIKRLQLEVNSQMQRATDIRNQYESLLSDVKSKLVASRDSEFNAQKQYKQSESDLKEVKSSLARTNIDLKMASMKLKNTEEKLLREKLLYEAQLKMKTMGIETQYQAKLNEIKHLNSKEMNAFLRKICEEFRSHFDPQQPISQQSVLSILKEVSKDLQNYKAANEARNDITLLRNMLKLQPYESVINAVQQLSEKNDNFINKEKQFNEEVKEAKSIIDKAKILSINENSSQEWEQWAKRLHLFITDQFSAAKTSKDLRFSLEEALLNSIGQRQKWRKMEILRTEKVIYSSGLLKEKCKRKKNPSIATFIIILNSIHRLQKLSGHLKCSISFIQNNESAPLKVQQKSKSDAKSKKNYPILNIV